MKTMRSSYEKKWRSFLNEEETFTAQLFPFDIYCDMDGVLVDLIGGIIKAADLKIPPEDTKQRNALMTILGSEKEWKDFKGTNAGHVLKFIHKLLSNDVEFWTNLPPMRDAMKLWSFITPLEPYILSHGWDAESDKGKRIWLSPLAGNIEPSPPQSKIILTGDKYKHAVNQQTGQPNILIDDMDKYLGPWAQAGGIGIKHISAENTIKELNRIMSDFRRGTDATEPEENERTSDDDNS
jgi:hypothetical protein